jgi:hypothetical protein
METLSSVLEKFKEKFPPAEKGEKEILMTTLGIFNAIDRFHPGLVFMMHELSDELIKMGYSYDAGIIGEVLEFRWKLWDKYNLMPDIKEKENSDETSP